MTGAPGTGKTAVLKHLGPEFSVIAEPAREVLAEQGASGAFGTHDRDQSVFVDLLLQRSIANFEAARQMDAPVVFDRGIPDCIAYAHHLGVDAGPSIEASGLHRYHHEVLLLEPWEAIYSTDEERTMAYAATVDFHEQIVDAYRRADYELVVVPKDSIGRRASFVSGLITDSGTSRRGSGS